MTFKELMESKDLNGYQLAALTGIRTQTLYNLRDGKHQLKRLNWENAEKIREVFGLTQDQVRELE